MATDTLKILLTSEENFTNPVTFCTRYYSPNNICCTNYCISTNKTPQKASSHHISISPKQTELLLRLAFIKPRPHFNETKKGKQVQHNNANNERHKQKVLSHAAPTATCAMYIRPLLTASSENESI